MTRMKEDRDESKQEPSPLVDEVEEVMAMDEDKPIKEDNPAGEVNEFPIGNGNHQPQTETDCNINAETKSGAEKPSLTSIPSKNEISPPQTKTKESIDNTKLKTGAKETLKASLSSEEEENPPQNKTGDTGINLGSKSNTEDVQTVSSPSATLNGYNGAEKKHDVEHPMDGEIKSYKIPGDESVPKHKNEPPTDGRPEPKGCSDANSSLKPETESPTVGKLENRESSVVNSLNPDSRIPTDGTPEVSDSTIDKSTVKADISTGHGNDETNDNGLPDSTPELVDVDRATVSNDHLESSKPIEISNSKPCEAPESRLGIDVAATSMEHGNINRSSVGSKTEPLEIDGEQNKCGRDIGPISKEPAEPVTPHVGPSNDKPALENKNCLKNENDNSELHIQKNNGSAGDLFLLEDNFEGSESGTEEEQSAFMKELECFFRERNMDFKPPKFYGEGLNCLKLWRSVMRLGGYDKVTSCKLWRQVGESFKPPKTCTTVSWTFRGFYEKALLDFERSKTSDGELIVSTASNSEPMNMIIDNQTPGSGRTRRDAAARAMQGWHSQRVLGNGEVGDPIIKDKSSQSWKNRDKQIKSIDGLGSLKRKKLYMEHSDKAARAKTSKQLDVEVTDIGPPAEWVKVNVEKLKDCFEIYALVPGLLREEVRVQLDPAGRVVISGQPQQPDNPWGVTPFRKVVTLPSRIDAHDTTAVVTLHGQLFVKTPFEQPSV